METTDNYTSINQSPLDQKNRHCEADIVGCIFVNGKFCILIEIPLKFVPNDPTDNIPAFV